MRIIILLAVGMNIAVSQAFDAKNFYKAFDKYRLAPENLMLMRHAFVEQTLHKLCENSDILSMERVGTSVKGRSINMVSFGHGETRLLLWSQMHGNEPTATAALLAVFNYLNNHQDEPFIKQLLDRLSVHIIVMLNPDGAQVFRRRNAMGIDINRDARLLRSPEAQTLKAMKERINPQFGFNLHDMGGRETVGDTKKLLTIALMAPPFNRANEDSPTRVRAKKLVVYLKKILDEFMPGHLARYKADYMPRAFGDAMQNWGVSTVLIESGMHDGSDLHFVERMNFIALFAAFDAIAKDKLEHSDAKEYAAIPLEGPEVFDILISNALICNGDLIRPFRADIGVNRDATLINGRIEYNSSIEDIGDLDITTGLKVINGKNLIVTPGLIVSGTEETEVEKLLERGITTYVTGNGAAEKGKDAVRVRLSGKKILQLKSMPDGKLNLKELPVYTVDAAKAIGLKNTGRLQKEFIADLLIFRQADTGELDFKNLKYVIKNGRIVFP